MTASKFVRFLTTALWLLLASVPARAGSNLDVARQLNQAFIEVAEKASPAVVVVNVKTKPVSWPDDPDAGGDLPVNTFSNEFWRQFHQQFQDQSPEEDQGSGVILRKDGFILTSRHVVANAEEIEVRLFDGRTFKARLRGADPQSDVAVLKIDADNLPVLRWADSSKTRVGEFAIAIGAPFNYDYSVTFGHVSAKGRANVISPLEGGGAMDQDFIQTDANINPGNSGGPLLNIEAEVIGINTMIRGLQTGIGFAIPGNLAREIADKLIADGKFPRPWLGVGIKALKDDPEFRTAHPGVKDGVIIQMVFPNGPAARSDLRSGDVIMAVDGKSVGSVQQLRDEVRRKAIGQAVALDVFRAGKTLQLQIKPAEYVVVMPQFSLIGGGRSEQTAATGLGLSVHAFTPELALRFGLKTNEGVIVVAVDANSPAARKGIKPGDIITAIDEQSISTTAQFTDALRKADLKKGVVVNLLNKDSARSEIFKEGNDQGDSRPNRE